MSDTDPCPPPPPSTRPSNPRPGPDPEAFVRRVEALSSGFAEGVAVMLRIEAALKPLLPLIPDLKMLLHELRRHGTEIAELRGEVDGLPCHGGHNGGVPPECPEAAE